MHEIRCMCAWHVCTGQRAASGVGSHHPSILRPRHIAYFGVAGLRVSEESPIATSLLAIEEQESQMCNTMPGSP